MSSLWIVFTVAAALAQTARNAMQRDLISTLGASGAATVRFLFGLPFACIFLAILLGVQGGPAPVPNGATLAWTATGAVAQIAATALMLMAMRDRSFVVAIAYTKLEPVLVALFGFLVLGDRVTPRLATAVLLATGGVLLMSWPRRTVAADEAFSWRPAVWGVASAGLFAVSAVGYRAGILFFAPDNFVLAATTTLVLALLIQTTLIVAVLAATNRALLRSIVTRWRPSLVAGFTGALASQFWFLAFAIETAARVRTLALVEIVFAQIVSRKLFGQGTSPRELLGVATMAIGVVMLVAG